MDDCNDRLQTDAERRAEFLATLFDLVEEMTPENQELFAAEALRLLAERRRWH